VNVLLRVGTLMVFARLLEPTDFGLIGMIAAVTGVLGVLKDFGLSAATVQRSSVTDQQMSTLFWLNLMLGALLWLLCSAIAPVLVVFYKEPRLLLATVVLAVGFLFTAAGVQHNALLQRQLRFTTLATIEILALLTSTAVGLGMAVAGFGYWALVGWSVALPAANCIGVWMAAGWLPGRPSRQAGVGSLVRFGGLVTLNVIVVQIAYNLDKVLLGRFWGADALGIYGRAYQLTNMATETLLATIGAVAFPALSRVREDPKLLESYFLKGYKLIVTMAMPIMIFCTLFAEDIILVLLGQKWLEAVPAFRWLSPLILVFALINPLGWLLYSLGFVGRSLKIALIIAPLVTVGYVVGLPYGAKGVAAGYTIMMTLWIVPHIVWSTRGTTLSLFKLLRVTRTPFLAGILAAGMGYAAQQGLAGVESPLTRLVIGGGILTASYLWLVLWVMGEKAFYFDLVRSLRRGPVD
jgi:O-antigen/teichoic acid export membrane protein